LARSSLSLESCTWRAPLFGGDRLVAGIPPDPLAILWSRHGAACDSWGSERIGRAFFLWHSVQFCWYRGPVSSLDYQVDTDRRRDSADPFNRYGLALAAPWEEIGREIRGVAVSFPRVRLLLWRVGIRVHHFPVQILGG